MSITLVNHTNIGLVMGTSIAYSETVDILPGQEGTLSDLHTGSAYNPRGVTVHPMRWITATPERKAKHQEDLRLQAVTAALSSSVPGGGPGSYAGEFGPAIVRLIGAAQKGSDPRPDMVYLDDRRIPAPEALWQLHSTGLDGVDAKPGAKLVATGGMSIEDDTATKIQLEYYHEHNDWARDLEPLDPIQAARQRARIRDMIEARSHLSGANSILMHHATLEQFHDFEHQ